MLSHSGSDNSGQAAMFVYGSIDDHMFDGVSSFFYLKKCFFFFTNELVEKHFSYTKILLKFFPLTNSMIYKTVNLS